MYFFKAIGNIFRSKKDLMPIFSQQAAFLCQASEALVNMLSTKDQDEWKRYQKEIKTCEVQCDALLTEFREQLSERLIGSMSRTDLTTVAMSMDDCLDVIKDASKAVLIYNPKKIDSQLLDLAQINIPEQSIVLHRIGLHLYKPGLINESGDDPVFIAYVNQFASHIFPFKRQGTVLCLVFLNFLSICLFSRKEQL